MKTNKKNRIIFVTGNRTKFNIASNILNNYGIELIQKETKTPEIQSRNGTEVANFSAKYAALKLKDAVIKTDVSYEIPALNNFPGPFVKFVNEWLTAKDILALMKNKRDRRLNIAEYLVYVDKNGNAKTFKTVSKCTISSNIKNDSIGSTFDKIVIREEHELPQNMLPQQELEKMFAKQVGVWKKLGKFLSKN